MYLCVLSYFKINATTIPTLFSTHNAFLMHTTSAKLSSTLVTNPNTENAQSPPLTNVWFLYHHDWTLL